MLLLEAQESKFERWGYLYIVKTEDLFYNVSQLGKSNVSGVAGELSGLQRGPSEGLGFCPEIPEFGAKTLATPGYKLM